MFLLPWPFVFAFASLPALPHLPCTSLDLCDTVTCRALGQCYEPGTCFRGTCTNPLSPRGKNCSDGSFLTTTSSVRSRSAPSLLLACILTPYVHACSATTASAWGFGNRLVFASSPCSAPTARYVCWDAILACSQLTMLACLPAVSQLPPGAQRHGLP